MTTSPYASLRVAGSRVREPDRRGVVAGQLVLDGLDRERVQDVDQPLPLVEEPQRVVPLGVPEVLAGRVEQVHQLGPAAATQPTSERDRGVRGCLGRVPAGADEVEAELRQLPRVVVGKADGDVRLAAISRRLFREAYRNRVFPAEVSPKMGTRTSRTAPAPCGSDSWQRLHTAVSRHAARSAIVGSCVPHSQRRTSRPSRPGRTSWCRFWQVGHW